VFLGAIFEEILLRTPVRDVPETPSYPLCGAAFPLKKPFLFPRLKIEDTVMKSALR